MWKKSAGIASSEKKNKQKGKNLIEKILFQARTGASELNAYIQ